MKVRMVVPKLICSFIVFLGLSLLFSPGKLSRLMSHADGVSKQEEFKQHSQIVFLDPDNLIAEGLPKLKTAMSDPSTFKMPCQIWFIAIKDGVRHSLGGLTIS